MARHGTLKKAATLSLAIAAGLGFSEAVHANALATAVLEVTGFTLRTADGSRPLVIGLDFNLPQGLNSIKDNGTNTASLDGVFDSHTLNVTGGGAMDVGQACVGAVCPGQNSFLHTTPLATQQLGRSDSKLDGAPVVGIPNESIGANARTVAEVQLTGSGSGTGDSRLGLNTTFDFTTTQSQAVQIAFDADLYLRAFLSGDVVGGSAQASSGLVFTLDKLVNGAFTNVFQWQPDGVVGTGITGGTELLDGENLNTSIVALVGGDNNSRDLAGSQSFAANTDILDAGSYRFSIRHTTAADADQVIPEPGTLALAGIALLGLVGVGRSKRKA